MVHADKRYSVMLYAIKLYLSSYYADVGEIYDESRNYFISFQVNAYLAS